MVYSYLTKLLYSQHLTPKNLFEKLQFEKFCSGVRLKIENFYHIIIQKIELFEKSISSAKDQVRFLQCQIRNFIGQIIANQKYIDYAREQIECLRGFKESIEDIAFTKTISQSLEQLEIFFSKNTIYINLNNTVKPEHDVWADGADD